ncbi:MAG TPA: hypothetical protein VN620_16510 [Candidatus Methylomirabilis sp.]|nr:hypothetical protein [Candidatus Methylomirabilis sp.]
MIRVLIAFLVLFTYSDVRLRPESREQEATPNRHPNYVAKDVGALDALVRLGALYNQPIGIICRDSEIVSRKVSLTVAEASVEESMRAVMNLLPEYEWSEDNGVFVVRPKVLPRQTEEMLNVIIPHIFAENIDMDGLSSRLWMELQVQVDPESRSRGFLLHGHLQNYYELGKVDLTNVRIDEVLNEIVRRRKIAAWVMLPPPDSIKGASRERLWGIVTYAQPPRPLSELCCLQLQDLY